MNTEQQEQQRTLTCSGCERELEWCAFCDQSNCPQPICYRCVREHLGEWVEYPNAKVASPKPD